MRRDTEDKSVTDTVAVVCYKEEGWKDKIRRRTRPWQCVWHNLAKNVDIDVYYPVPRREILDTLAEFQ